VFYTVVRWHKLGEVVSECTVHNNIVLAIFLPKIIKVGGNLTKLCPKQFWLFFWVTVWVWLVKIKQLLSTGIYPLSLSTSRERRHVEREFSFSWRFVWSCCLRVFQDQWRRGRGGRHLIAHPKFLAAEKLSEKLFLVRKFSFKNAKCGHFREI